MIDKSVKKGLVFAVILLFIGVAIQPGISTNTIQEEKTDVDAKNYLFQTIIDMVNNKEIQNIIQKSENRGSLTNSLHKPGLIISLMKSRTPFRLLSQSTFLTKNFLEYAYRIGVKLSRTIDVSKMHLILQRYQVRNQEVQKEINTIIENNANLKAEITQLSSLNCDCEKNNAMNWSFPVICLILLIIFMFLFYIGIIAFVIFRVFVPIVEAIGDVIIKIYIALNCRW